MHLSRYWPAEAKGPEGQAQKIKKKSSRKTAGRNHKVAKVCHSSREVEDEQHFLFSCPAYSDVRQNHASLFQQAFTVSDFFTNSEQNACGGFLRECFSLRKSIVST